MAGEKILTLGLNGGLRGKLDKLAAAITVFPGGGSNSGLRCAE